MSAVCQPSVEGETRESILRPALWIVAALLAVLFFGPSLISVFKLPPDLYPDFVQEWLSAKNFAIGESIYLPQREAMRLHTGQDIPAFSTEMPWNAHPPVAVLLVLPFGLFSDFRTAHLAWNLATFPLFVLSLVLVMRELKMEMRWWSIFVVTALVLPCNAVLTQLYQGQLNFPLLFLLVIAWIADRRGLRVGAGAAVGVAMALKIFPGLLLVYFAATRRWRSVFAALGVAILLNAAALVVFGPTAFRTYMGEVLPSLNVFRNSWLNISLTGYWTRVGIALERPAIGSFTAGAFQLAVVGMVWWYSRRAATSDDHDRAFSLAVIGMLLASPVAWSHYFVLLVLPILLLWQRLPRGPATVALVATGAVMWIQESFFPGLMVGRATMKDLINVRQIPGGLPMAVVGLAPFTVALLVLFVLMAFARFNPPRDSGHAGATDSKPDSL